MKCSEVIELNENKTRVAGEILFLNTNLFFINIKTSLKKNLTASYKKNQLKKKSANVTELKNIPYKDSFFLIWPGPVW